MRDARIRANLSQRDLAFRGCTPAYISRIEAGKRIPSLQLLRELGLRLGVSADYLARGSSDQVFTEPLGDAEMALRLGDLDAAEPVFREGATPTSDQRTQARALAGLGQIAFHRGSYADAAEKLAQAAELWPRLEDENPGLADTLGRAYTQTFAHESAIGVYERRLRRAEEAGDLIEQTRFGVLLANALVAAGNSERAEEILTGVLALGEDSSVPLVRARLWWSQSRLHALRSDPATAERYARLALDTLLLSEHVRYSALAYQVLAHIKLDSGAASEALDLLDQGLPRVREGANAHEEALFAIERARALARLDRAEEALELAIQASDALGGASAGDEGRARAVLGEVYEHLGRNGEAIDAYRQAAEVLPIGDRFKLEVNAKLADLLRREGRTEEALDVLSRAVSQVDPSRPRS